MAAAVEAPLTFFQEPIKAVFWDAVEASQMALGLVPKVLNAVDVMSSFANKNFTMVYASVMKLRYVQHVISSKAVSINDAIR